MVIIFSELVIFRSQNTKDSKNEIKLYTQKTVLSNQQNYFVGIYATKHFAISIKFFLLKQNVLSGQQKKFRCINFFLSVV